MSTNRRHNRFMPGLLAILMGGWLLASAAFGQVKIDRARLLGPLLATADGQLVLFYGSGRDGQRIDSYVVSADQGKQWSKPAPVARFNSAAMAADGTIFVAAYDNRGFVLDTLTSGNAGWQLKQDIAHIYAIDFHDDILGPNVALTLEDTPAGQKLWAVCSWREDETVGDKKTANYRFLVFGSPAAQPKFALNWEDKEGFAQDPGATILGFWQNRPILYAPQHYASALAAFDGQKWNIREKFVDWGKSLNVWVGAYGQPLPRLIATANDYLHIGQCASGLEKNPSAAYLITVSPRNVVSTLNLGDDESLQFLRADGNDVLVGMKYAVTEHMEDVEKKYESFYIARCQLDPATGKYKKIGHELTVSDSQTMKGNMVAAEPLKSSSPIPVAYLDEANLFFKLVPEHPRK